MVFPWVRRPGPTFPEDVEGARIAGAEDFITSSHVALPIWHGSRFDLGGGEALRSKSASMNLLVCALGPCATPSASYVPIRLVRRNSF